METQGSVQSDNIVTQWLTPLLCYGWLAMRVRKYGDTGFSAERQHCGSVADSSSCVMVDRPRLRLGRGATCIRSNGVEIQGVKRGQNQRANRPGASCFVCSAWLAVAVVMVPGQLPS